MVKPDWCPQGVWDEATKIEGGSNPMLVDRIARAIMAAEQRGEERRQPIIDAAERLLMHWDWNGQETQGEFEGGSYWSPAGRMVDTEFIVALRAAIRNRSKP